MSVQGYKDIKRKITFGVLEKYPDAPSNALAKMIYKNNPEFFTDKEHARTYIRLYRGKLGKIHRDGMQMRKYYTK